MMHTWHVKYEVNGSEYVGNLWLEAKRVEQLDAVTLVADGVQITLDEPILSIEQGKETQ